MLDERVLNELAELVSNYNQKNVARALEVQQGFLDVIGRF
jgi:hypothetical protein